MSALIVMTGKRFGRLVILRRAGSQHARATWVAVCDCGTEIVAIGSAMQQGKTRSCGCLRRESTSATGSARRTHGMTDTPTYSTWQSMVLRCTKPSYEGYDNYGARGISVCERWLDFSAFYEDMGERPQGTSIDRIDNSLGYEKANCRWATPLEQTLNRSITRYLTLNGRCMCMTDWARELDIPVSRISKRLAKGWSDEDALLRTDFREVARGRALLESDLAYARARESGELERRRLHRAHEAQQQRLGEVL